MKYDCHNHETDVHKRNDNEEIPIFSCFLFVFFHKHHNAVYNRLHYSHISSIEMYIIDEMNLTLYIYLDFHHLEGQSSNWMVSTSVPQSIIQFPYNRTYSAAWAHGQLAHGKQITAECIRRIWCLSAAWCGFRSNRMITFYQSQTNSLRWFAVSAEIGFQWKFSKWNILVSGFLMVAFRLPARNYRNTRDRLGSFIAIPLWLIAMVLRIGETWSSDSGSRVPRSQRHRSEFRRFPDGIRADNEN